MSSGSRAGTIRLAEYADDVALGCIVASLAFTSVLVATNHGYVAAPFYWMLGGAVFCARGLAALGRARARRGELVLALFAALPIPAIIGVRAGVAEPLLLGTVSVAVGAALIARRYEPSFPRAALVHAALGLGLAYLVTVSSQFSSSPTLHATSGEQLWRWAAGWPDAPALRGALVSILCLSGAIAFVLRARRNGFRGAGLLPAVGVVGLGIVSLASFAESAAMAAAVRDDMTTVDALGQLVASGELAAIAGLAIAVGWAVTDALFVGAAGARARVALASAGTAALALAYALVADPWAAPELTDSFVGISAYATAFQMAPGPRGPPLRLEALPPEVIVDANGAAWSLRSEDSGVHYALAWTPDMVHRPPRHPWDDAEPRAWVRVWAHPHAPSAALAALGGGERVVLLMTPATDLESVPAAVRARWPALDVLANVFRTYALEPAVTPSPDGRPLVVVEASSDRDVGSILEALAHSTDEDRFVLHGRPPEAAARVLEPPVVERPERRDRSALGLALLLVSIVIAVRVQWEMFRAPTPSRGAGPYRGRATDVRLTSTRWTVLRTAALRLVRNLLRETRHAGWTLATALLLGAIAGALIYLEVRSYRVRSDQNEVVPVRWTSTGPAAPDTMSTGTQRSSASPLPT